MAHSTVSRWKNKADLGSFLYLSYSNSHMQKTNITVDQGLISGWKLNIACNHKKNTQKRSKKRGAGPISELKKIHIHIFYSIEYIVFIAINFSSPSDFLCAANYAIQWCPYVINCLAFLLIWHTDAHERGYVCDLVEASMQSGFCKNITSFHRLAKQTTKPLVLQLGWRFLVIRCNMSSKSSSVGCCKSIEKR